MTQDSGVVKIYCSGELREIPWALWANLWEPKPPRPDQFVCNGCSYSPDFLFGKAAWPACVIHDYQYNQTAVDRSEADAIFKRNFKYCLEAEGMPGWLAGAFAAIYYRVVRREGARFYNGKGKND